MTDSDRRYLAKYFSSLSNMFFIWIVLGVLGVILSIGLHTLTIFFIACISFILAVVQYYDHFHGMPSDKDVSNIIGMDLQGYEKIALAALGLVDGDVVGKYIYLWSPEERDIDKVENHIKLIPFRLRLGQDGLYRFVYYKVTVLVPTEHYLGYFSCLHSILNKRYTNYQTGEYYYEEVVSLRTKGSRHLTLSFTDGDSFSVEIPSDNMARYLYQSHHVRFVRFETAVQSIRKMILPHKEGKN